MKPPSKFTLTLSVGFKINKKKRPNPDKKITQDNILISLRVVLLILASVMLKANPYLKTTKRADDLMDLSGIFKCV